MPVPDIMTCCEPTVRAAMGPVNATLAARVQTERGRNLKQTRHCVVMSTGGACLLCGRKCHDAELHDNGGGSNTGRVCNACRAALEHDLRFDSGSRGIRSRKPGWRKRRSSRLRDLEAREDSEGGARCSTPHKHVSHREHMVRPLARSVQREEVNGSAVRHDVH